jgi:hypothetical protein
MSRVFIFLSCLLWAAVVLATPASSLYQVDMILFAYLQSSPLTNENITPPLLTTGTVAPIVLQHGISNSRAPYHLLSSSNSQLKNEYWALNRKPEYRVLFHYTWLQKANNQRPVELSEQNQGGWTIEGTMRIRQSNYYLLDTDIVFSTPDKPQTAFVFSQKQRLKPDVVYYLDHPQAGMLIKIHQIT